MWAGLPGPTRPLRASGKGYRPCGRHEVGGPLPRSFAVSDPVWRLPNGAPSLTLTFTLADPRHAEGRV